MDHSVTPQELLQALASATPPMVIDVRRSARFDEAADMIAGAGHRDPELLADGMAALPRDRAIVVYCVHGHEVSQNAARVLREAGLRARYLEGGIEGWRAAGGPMAMKPVR